MTECLADPRADVAVSEWLQARMLGADPRPVPHEVQIAALADQFLMNVNSGGLDSFFENYR